MKHRDKAALSACRTALAAIDNAEAAPLDPAHRAGAIEAAPVGIGRADVERLELTSQQMVEIVRAEASDRIATAESLAGKNVDVATRLRREAEVLLALLAEADAGNSAEIDTSDGSG